MYTYINSLQRIRYDDISYHRAAVPLAAKLGFGPRDNITLPTVFKTAAFNHSATTP